MTIFRSARFILQSQSPWPLTFSHPQTGSESRPFQQPTEILAVPIGAMCARQGLKLRSSDEPELERYLFRTGNLQSLPLLNSLNEGRSLQKRVMRARIEPCHAASKNFRRQP